MPAREALDRRIELAPGYPFVKTLRRKETEVIHSESGLTKMDMSATRARPSPYSPDFNSIKMAFAKLKALLRAAARTIPDLWQAIADALRRFTRKNAPTISPSQDRMQHAETLKPKRKSAEVEWAPGGGQRSGR
jgi:hypothetical protein